jgi:hypothetical protein
VNYPPRVSNEPGDMSFPEDSWATVDLARMFVDPDGQPLNFSVTGAAYLNATIQGGMATVRTASALWPAGWDGRESLTFAATDPFNASARLTVNFTVVPVDEPPYVFRILPNQSMLEDLNLTLFNLNGYFRDQHGDPLNFAVSGAANLTVRISPDGNVSLTPAPNWTGQTSMTFTATDQFGGRAQLQFNLTVEPVNDAPVLTEAMLSPSKGDPTTVFTFSVVCRDVDSANITVRLFIGRRSLPMERVQGDLKAGALFRVQTTLPEGASSYYFEADDTDKVTDTGSFEVKVSSAPVDNTWLYIMLGVAIIVMLALALAFTPPRKHRWEEQDEEE